MAVPPFPAAAGAGYEKFARVEGDFATVSVAAVLTMDGGKCETARVALGSCGPTPVRVEAAEEALVGSDLGQDAIDAAAALLVEACDPVDDFRGSGEYRMMLVAPLLGRALATARGNAGDGK